MELEGYKLIEHDGKFESMFYSEGPRGLIKKGVKFQPYPEMGKNVYNVSFGDIDSSTGRIDDLMVSNNVDHEKVLKTVADAVVEFFEIMPRAILRVRGSSLSRRRLYQMKISKFLHEVRRRVQVYGVRGQSFTPFEKGVNYDAFIITKK